MQAKPADTVHSEIVGHIQKQGGPASSWYAGIASDWSDRLFNGHNVSRTDHWYIARQCFNADDARRVEAALINFGCDGGGGGGDRSTVYVYAYLKSAVTTP
jgi:hypothetical protein